MPILFQKRKFVIIGFLSFILVALSAIFIVLQHGLDIQEISFANITAKKVYIQWDGKLNIAVEELSIKKTKQSKHSKTFKEIKKTLLNAVAKYIDINTRYLSYIKSLSIKKIKYDTIRATLKYNAQKKALFTLKASDFYLYSHFKIDGDKIVFDIDDLTGLKNKIKAKGIITIDTKLKKIFTKTEVHVNNDADLILYGTADQDRFTYRINSKKKIEDIHSFIALFHLSDTLKFWAMDAIDASSLQIHKIQGFVKYDALNLAYKNLYISATLNKLNYTYNPKLDAIHTQKSELEFSKGVLSIYPKEAYTCKVPLQKSWVKIDFTKPQSILRLHLLFHARLDNDIMHILDAYKISLPFIQHTGKIKTDLTLAINLETLDVDTQGTFSTKKANIDYAGINLDVKDLLIKLNNSNISIVRMKVHYNNGMDAVADSTAHYNTKSSTGEITFYFTKIKLSADEYLKTQKKPLKVVYKIFPKDSRLIIDKSKWHLKDVVFVLDSLTLSPDFKNLQVNIPTTHFGIEDIANGVLKGAIDIKHHKADFVLNLSKLNYMGIGLIHPITDVNLHIDKNIRISSSKNILLNMNGVPWSMKHLLLKIDKRDIQLQHTKVKVDNYFKSDIQVLYDAKRKIGDIYLKNAVFTEPKTKKVLYHKKQIHLLVKTEKKQTKIDIKELEATLIINQKRWILSFNSLGKIAKNFNILRKYHIDNGNTLFYKNNDEEPLHFITSLRYKYKILTNYGKAVPQYKIEGKILKNKTILLSVNDKVNLRVDRDININIQNSGIDINELLAFIKSLPYQKTKKSNMDIYVKAKNSYIYLESNRYILSDSITIVYKNGELSGDLTYAKGKMHFTFKDNKFSVIGKNFNEKFAKNIITFAKLKGGDFNFSIDGTPDEYRGSVTIGDTVIKDYVLLNNILAFVNTVPSLVTFSLPGYSTNGVHADKVYTKFHFKKDIFYISDFIVKSKEIRIAAKGSLSSKYDTIDMKAELKTNFGSTLSKIPLAGYIVFDGKTLSTNLKITGKLSDPKVRTMVAKDIVSAPVNIMKRTLGLPFKLMKGILK